MDVLIIINPYVNYPANAFVIWSRADPKFNTHSLVALSQGRDLNSHSVTILLNMRTTIWGKPQA